ncbi:MAG: multidrug ABC transporter permease [Chloroflexi bacterium RBG_16_50_9]|nr:MAG: multidrug ABC transporter permease [Chloroflexi bacterium RBG_16_50_9]
MNIGTLATNILTITDFELRKVRHDMSQILIRAIQPVLWLLVFGEVFARTRLVPTGDYSYLQFLTPGVLAQSVIFVAIFYGFNLVMDRDMGLLHKLLSTPIPRYSIVLGKTLSAGVRSVIQALVVFILALILRVQLILNPFTIIGVFVIIILTGMCFSSLSIFLASFFKTRERMMGIGQAIVMPLFFASSAIYPIDIMPTWLKVVARINPLSYIVEAMRALLVTGHHDRIALDLGVTFLATVMLVTIASMSFSRIIR